MVVCLTQPHTFDSGLSVWLMPVSNAFTSYPLNSFLARVDFFHLLETFANSLDPDQDRLNVGSDQDLNYLTLIVFLKEFFDKFNFEKSQQTTTKT